MTVPHLDHPNKQTFCVANQTNITNYLQPNRGRIQKEKRDEVMFMVKFSSYVFASVLLSPFKRETAKNEKKNDWGKCLGLPHTVYGPANGAVTLVNITTLSIFSGVSLKQDPAYIFHLQIT